MLSHDLANALLSHRNNDVKFIVEVSLPGRDDDEDLCRVEMADDRAKILGWDEIPPAEVVKFNSERDWLEVKLGAVYAGRQGSVVLEPEDVALVVKALGERHNDAAYRLAERIEREAGA
jgi:hypothetical protein